MRLFVKAGISGRYSNTTHTKHQHVTSPGGGGGASEHKDPLPHQQSGLQVRAGQHGLQRLQVIIVEMASAFPSRYRPSQPVHGGVRQRGLNTGSNHTKQQEPWPKRGSKVVGWICLRLLGGCGRNKSVTSRHVALRVMGSKQWYLGERIRELVDYVCLFAGEYGHNNSTQD